MRPAEPSVAGGALAAAVVPSDASASRFEGFVGMFEVAFDAGGRNLALDPALERALGPARAEALRGRVAGLCSAEAVATEVADAARRCGARGIDAHAAAPSAEFYARVARDVAELGGAAAAVAPDLAAVTVRAVDAGGREHLAEVSLPPGFPAAPPAVAADLPEPVAVRWGEGATLARVAAAVAESAARWQLAWASLEELDARCHVLEPERPRRADLHRRVATAEPGVTLAVAVREDGAGPPELRVLGADAAAAPVRARLADALAAWDGAKSVLANLEAALGTLPARPDAGAEADASAAADALECGICYTRALDGDETEVTCENAACGRLFHAPCLAEWLRADTSTRRVFNTLYGSCPYCSAMLAVLDDGA